MLVFEVVIVLLFLLFAKRWPKTAAVVSVIVSVAVGYGLYAVYAVGPFGPAVNGASVVGRSTMRAGVFAPELESGVRVETSVPVPDHTPSHVLVEVAAAGLNPSNYKMVPAAIPFVRHLRKFFVIGYDVAGIVRSVGADPVCSNFAVGDEVYGLSRVGSMAEFTTLHCEMASKKPQSLSFEEAASLPVAALTSLEALERADAKEGDRVLVIGASGGCGIFGIALAKAIGAHATGVCSARNVEFVRSAGADRVVDYTDPAALAELYAEKGQYDVVYDTVTSFAPEDPNYEADAAPLLKAGRKYIAINGMRADWLRMVAERAVGVPLQRPGYELFMLTVTRARLERLAALFDGGKMAGVPIDSTFTLESDAQLQAAFARMRSRRATGKIVLLPSGKQ